MVQLGKTLEEGSRSGLPPGQGWRHVTVAAPAWAVGTAKGLEPDPLDTEKQPVVWAAPSPGSNPFWDTDVWV